MQNHLTRIRLRNASALFYIHEASKAGLICTKKTHEERFRRAAQAGRTEADEASGEKHPASFSRPAAAPAESQSCCHNNRLIFPQITEGRWGVEGGDGVGVKLSVCSAATPPPRPATGYTHTRKRPLCTFSRDCRQTLCEL